MKKTLLRILSVFVIVVATTSTLAACELGRGKENERADKSDNGIETTSSYSDSGSASVSDGVGMSGSASASDVAGGSAGGGNETQQSEVAVDGIRLVLNEDAKSFTVAGFVGSGKEELTIPSSYNGIPVTKVGEKAFYLSDIIKKLTIESGGVKEIGSSAFEQCGGLVEAVIGDGVEAFGGKAFYYCGALKTIRLPDSLEKIGYNVFTRCNSLEFNDFNDAKYLGNEENPYILLMSLTDNAATSFSAPAGTRIVCSRAFKSKTLVDVTFCDGLKWLDKEAFYSCAIKDIVLPDSVIGVGADVFAACNDLKTVTVGKGIQSIASAAFENLPALETVVIHKDAPIERILSKVFFNCESLKSIVISDNVQGISNNAFKGCKSLAHVVLGKSVEYLEFECFCDCESMEYIVIDVNFKGMGGDAFKNCKALSAVYYLGNERQFARIEGFGKEFDAQNRIFAYATKYYYSETRPDIIDKYWHYVDGQPSVWTFPTSNSQ